MPEPLPLQDMLSVGQHKASRKGVNLRRGSRTEPLVAPLRAACQWHTCAVNLATGLECKMLLN